ncbi:MAG: PAS domain S-box protein [Elusimicrobiota bacterium]|jgi:PAS domain S-box-containing protein
MIRKPGAATSGADASFRGRGLDGTSAVHWPTLAAIAATTLAALAVGVYCLSSGVFIVFQNLLYIPIIIACVSHPRRGVVFSTVLAAAYMLLILAYTRDHAILLQAATRVVIFIVIAGVVSFLTSKRRHAEDELNVLEARRRAEETLRSASAYNRSLIEASLDPLVTIAVDGKITDVNTATEKATGFPRERLVGTDFSEYFTDPARAQAGYRRVFEDGEVRDYALELRHRDGSIVPVLYNASVYRDEAGAVVGVFAAARDVAERRRAEAGLRESEERFRTLIEAAPEAVFVQAEGKFLYANPAAVRLFGAARSEDLIGEDFMARMAPEARELIRERIRLQKETGKAAPLMEMEYLRLDGTRVPVETTAVPVVYVGKAAHMVFVRDVSVRKRAEAERDESRVLLRSVVDSTNDLIWAVDPKDFGLTTFNIGLQEHFAKRRSIDIRPGMRPEDLFPDKEHIEQWHGFYRRALREGPYSTEYATVGPVTLLLSFGLLERDGRPFGISVFAKDITERKRAEESIRRLHRVQVVLSSVNRTAIHARGLQELFDETCRVIVEKGGFRMAWLGLVDAPAAAVTVAASAGVTGDYLQNLHITLRDEPRGRGPTGTAIREGRHVVCRDFSTDPAMAPWRERALRYGYRSSAVFPLKVDGRMRGALSIYAPEAEFFDEAEVALLEEAMASVAYAVGSIEKEAEREKLQAQLLQAQKMESIGRLAGGVAHDFNNLLTAITGNCRFLLDELPESDSRHADLKEIEDAAERAAALTRQLLAFSRRQILTPRVVDLNAVVGDMNRMLMRLIGEDVPLVLELSPVPCLVKVDAGQIEQVIMNLVVNARDAMPKGGTVTVGTEVLEGDEVFFAAHPALLRVPQVCLKIRDTGCGIPAECLGRIFEPFYTTKEVGKGTGLGLPTVLGIVQQSGGEIELESVPGTGTTFRIYLPRQDASQWEKEKDAAKGERQARPVRGHETVLLVEDEDIVRRLAERALRAGGYAVLSAGDGSAALKALEDRGKPVDVLLTDMVMPGMSGRALAREVARRKLAARTLYFSGYAGDAFAEQGGLEPGMALLYKPFTPSSLLRKLRETLDGPADQAKA